MMLVEAMCGLVASLELEVAFVEHPIRCRDAQTQYHFFSASDSFVVNSRRHPHTYGPQKQSSAMIPAIHHRIHIRMNSLRGK